MKISSQLKAAIRLVVEEHNTKLKQDTEKRTQEKIDAIRRQRGIPKLMKELIQARNKVVDIEGKIQNLGFQTYGDNPAKYELEQKIRGVAPEGLHFDGILSRLSKATQKEGDQILKNLGIVW